MEKSEAWSKGGKKSLSFLFLFCFAFEKFPFMYDLAAQNVNLGMYLSHR